MGQASRFQPESRQLFDALRDATLHPRAAGRWPAASSRPSAPTAHHRAGTHVHLRGVRYHSHPQPVISRRMRSSPMTGRAPGAICPLCRAHHQPIVRTSDRHLTTVVGSAPDQRSNARGSTSMRHLARFHRRETVGEIPGDAFRQTEHLRPSAACLDVRYLQNRNLRQTAVCSADRLLTIEHLRHSAACLLVRFRSPKIAPRPLPTPPDRRAQFYRPSPTHRLLTS